MDVSRVEAAIGRLTDQLSVICEEAATKGAERIADEERLLFRSSDDASIAGLPPRIQTGGYIDSIQTVPFEQETDRASAVTGTSLVDPPYPRFLEFGTSRMPAHPIARPAYEIAKDDAHADTIFAFRDGIRAAVG